jgi:hypothetical protein
MCCPAGRDTSADGTRMYEYLFFPLLDENGRIDGVGGVTRDITECKHAEQSVRNSEQRFRTLADHVPQLIWTNDAGGRVNYRNRRWSDYSGLTLDASDTVGWQAIVHPDDGPTAREKWQQAALNLALSPSLTRPPPCNSCSTPSSPGSPLSRRADLLDVGKNRSGTFGKRWKDTASRFAGRWKDTRDVC